MRYGLLSLLLIVLPSVSAQTPAEKGATIKFLQELQAGDGGFLPVPADPRRDTDPRGGVRATSAALRALKYLGGAPKNQEAAAQFIARCFDAPTGAFADQPGGRGDVASTAIGLMAAAEARLPLKDYAKAITFLAETAREFEEVRIAAAAFETFAQVTGETPEVPSGWIDGIRASLSGPNAASPRHVAGVMVTLMRLTGRTNANEVIVSLLNRGHNTDGGFSRPDSTESDLESSYRVMRLFHMLKTRPTKADDLRVFVAKCRNADGGYGPQPGKPSSVGSTYQAAIILHWLTEG